MSWEYFIIYLDKFEYDVEENECEPFSPLKHLFKKNVLTILLINIWIFYSLLVYMWGVEGVTMWLARNINMRLMARNIYEIFNLKKIYFKMSF